MHFKVPAAVYYLLFNLLLRQYINHMLEEGLHRPASAAQNHGEFILVVGRFQVLQLGNLSNELLEGFL